MAKENYRKSVSYEKAENGYIITVSETWEEKDKYKDNVKKYIEPKALNVKNKINELMKVK